MINRFAYVRPGSLSEALDQLENERSRVHAGGTDLLTCLRDHVFAADKVVSISRLDDLHGIEEQPDNTLSIGALTTITEIEEDPVIRRKYPGLSQAASEVGSPQLRNQGTIGGNICQKPRCWYYRGDFHCLRKGGSLCYAVGGENQFHCILGGKNCFIVHPSDTAPALLSFGARVVARGPNGTRTIDMEKFHVPPGEDPQRETVLEPGEVVTEILLPPPQENTRSSYRKVRARRSWDFALAGVALALNFNGERVQDGRVAFSGVAPVPWRSREVENAIKGRRLDEKTITQAADAAVDTARPLSGNAYKIPLLKGVVYEELWKMGAGA